MIYQLEILTGGLFITIKAKEGKYYLAPNGNFYGPRMDKGIRSQAIARAKKSENYIDDFESIGRAWIDYYNSSCQERVEFDPETLTRLT